MTHVIYTAFWTGLDWRFCVEQWTSPQRCPRPYGDMKTILHQWVEGLWGDPLQASFQPRLCGWRSRLPQKLSLERSKSCVSNLAASIAQSSSSANRKAFCRQDATKYSNFWLRTNLWHRGGTIDKRQAASFSSYKVRGVNIVQAFVVIRPQTSNNCDWIYSNHWSD